MISLYPLGGGATASRGNFEGVYRLLVSGGAVVGGDAGWQKARLATGFETFSGGAVVNGGAKFAPLFCYLTGRGAVGGGYAKYPWRLDRPVGGAVVGGNVRWPYQMPTIAGAVGGSGIELGQSVRFTYWWGLAIAQTNTGGIVGGHASTGYKLHSDIMLQYAPVAAKLLAITVTTKHFTMTEV